MVESGISTESQPIPHTTPETTHNVTINGVELRTVQRNRWTLSICVTLLFLLSVLLTETIFYINITNIHSISCCGIISLPGAPSECSLQQINKVGFTPSTANNICKVGTTFCDHTPGFDISACLAKSGYQVSDLCGSLAMNASLLSYKESRYLNFSLFHLVLLFVCVVASVFFLVQPPLGIKLWYFSHSLLVVLYVWMFIFTLTQWLHLRGERSFHQFREKGHPVHEYFVNHCSLPSTNAGPYVVDNKLFYTTLRLTMLVKIAFSCLLVLSAFKDMCMASNLMTFVTLQNNLRCNQNLHVSTFKHTNGAVQNNPTITITTTMTTTTCPETTD